MLVAQAVGGVRADARRYRLLRTPENVGPVVRGDVMEGHIDGLPNLSVKVV
jgi:hypothetical protein